MNWTQTRDALVTAGIDPARLPDNWQFGINLRRTDLSGANLSGANLSCANLSGANLSGADLSAADLSAANLYDADLSAADLYDADLSAADLYGADLRGAALNWNSHDLLAEIARHAAGDNLQYRMLAGLILISRDWCWEKFVAVLDDDARNWLGSVFAPYVKDGDGAPDVVRKYAKENER